MLRIVYLCLEMGLDRVVCEFYFMVIFQFNMFELNKALTKKIIFTFHKDIVCQLMGKKPMHHVQLFTQLKHKIEIDETYKHCA